MDRRGRRLQDLERGGEEFPVAEVHSPSLAWRLEPRERTRGQQLGGGTRFVARGRSGDQGHAAISAGWL